MPQRFLTPGYYTENAQELMVTTDSVGDSIALAPDDPYLLKFDYDDEVEFTFGAFADQNEGVFYRRRFRVRERFCSTTPPFLTMASPPRTPMPKSSR